LKPHFAILDKVRFSSRRGGLCLQGILEFLGNKRIQRLPRRLSGLLSEGVKLVVNVNDCFHTSIFPLKMGVVKSEIRHCRTTAKSFVVPALAGFKPQFPPKGGTTNDFATLLIGIDHSSQLQ
jgi:hypothetical protein